MNYFHLVVRLILMILKKKKDAATQTFLTKIDVIIHNKDENLVNLFVRRSFSEHLYSWINDSCVKVIRLIFIIIVKEL